MVAEHPDDLVRDQYVMQVADRCRLEPDRVRQRLEEARRRPAAPAGRGEDAATSTGGVRGRARDRQRPDAADRPPCPGRGPGVRRAGTRCATPCRPAGLEALRLAVHRPEEVADRLEEVLFVDDLQRRAFVALAEADNLHQAVEEAPPEVADLLRRVTVEEPVRSTTRSPTR